MIESRDKALTLGFRIIVFMAILGLMLTCVSTHNKSMLIDIIADNKDSLTFYLDGVEVSYESVELSNYDITYDEVNNIVKLTKPVPRTHSHVSPVIIY